jgi:thiol-disulfide isomerase/thioredoxin
MIISWSGTSQNNIYNSLSFHVVGSKDVVSLAEVARGQSVVLIFVTDNCPYNQKYAERIKILTNQFTQVSFAIVNEGRKAVQVLDQANAIQLYDINKQAKKLLGARKSPEIVVLKNNKGNFTRFYSGAIDDDPLSAGDVNNDYLRNALASLTNDKLIDISTTTPVGCILR